MTLNQLLLTKEYRGNQSLLSRELGINRGTLRKYLTDEEGENHHINTVDGKYVMFGKLSKECKS